MKYLSVLFLSMLMMACDEDAEGVNADNEPVVGDIVSEHYFEANGSEYTQQELSCIDGYYQSVTLKDGEELHVRTASCGVYVDHAIDAFGYRLIDQGDDIQVLAYAKSLGTHCSIGDLYVTFDGVDIDNIYYQDANICDASDVNARVPALTDEIVKYAIVIEFFGYNGEYARKYISVDAWRVE